jgi:ferredoxin
MPRVSIKDTEMTFDVNDGEVIYDSLHEQGYILPHGCLSGSCGACRVEVCEGAENLGKPGPIEQNTIDAVTDEFKIIKGDEFVRKRAIRLSCRAKVHGDVVIKPLK